MANDEVSTILNQRRKNYDVIFNYIYYGVERLDVLQEIAKELKIHNDLYAFELQQKYGMQK